MTNIVEQSYWNKQYKNVLFRRINRNDSLYKTIQTIIPIATKKSTAIEIGCYPCRYLSMFGELGYELNGIDLNPDVLKIKDIIKAEGFQVGDVIHGDFLGMNVDKKYDIVSSFGFIEHFTNLEDIIKKHIELLKIGGYLVLDTPNFNGFFQYWFHKLFDTPNLKRHVRKNMDPFYWKEIIEKNGCQFDFLLCEYRGGIDFWTDKDQPYFQNLIAKIVKRIWFTIRWLCPFLKKVNGKSCSRSCILIAKRIK